MRKVNFLLVLLVFLLSLANLSESQGLTGDWNGSRTILEGNGLNLSGDITNYYQGLVVGDGNQSWDTLTRYDFFTDLDFSKMGLVKGLGFHVHGEGRFDDGQANFGGQLFPANTGAILPLGGSDLEATSLYFTQAIGKRSSLMFGKTNAIDLLAFDPIFGGWATKRFQNIAFVAPPSGVVPPTIVGAVGSHRYKEVTFTVMAFDTADRTRDYFGNNLFSNGVNLSTGATWGTSLYDRPTSLGLTSTYSTADSQDLETILLQPGFKTKERDGSYNISLQFSHRLFESKSIKNKGIDVTMKAALADGNPNPIQSSFIFGLVGQGLISDRPDDSFGVGTFFYNFSNDLQDTISPLVTFNDEQGVELWYSIALTTWLTITADIQLIEPAKADNDQAIVGLLRTNLVF